MDKIEEKSENMEKTPIETTKSSNENILKQYEDLSPINLVDTVERYYHTFLPNQNKENLNILSSYKSKTNVKFQLIDFTCKKELTKKLEPKLNNIQTLKIYGDYLFAADKSGSVFMYSVSKEQELKVFTPSGAIDYYASSIDVSPTVDYIIVGYSNGYITLWDTKKPSLIYTIKEFHNTKIVLAQFSQIIEKKKFEIISSDMSGKLLKLVLSISIFKKSVQDFMIYKDDVPTYAITQFKPLRNKQIVIGAFCNINKIRVYILRPIFISFFEIERPDCYDENCIDIPDISFGWGCEPFEFEEDYAQMKLDDTPRQNQIILAVSWGQLIRIYSLNIKGEDIILNGEGPKSYFINNSPVIRLGFISPSIIYFFDKNAEVKIINTAYTQYGEYHQEKKGEFIYNKRALVEEGKIIDPNLIKINVSNNKDKQLFCFRYFINNMSKCIYLCTQKGFYLGKVLNFDECIYNLVKEDDWLGAMSLTIDIYQGNITSFPDIPFIRKQRIKTLKPFLIDLLGKYINYNLEENEKKPDTKIDLNQCINVVIEFCIGVKEIDYLFKTVEKNFRSKGKSGLFYQLLEPFIFNDLLNQDPITEESLISLYTTYKSNKSLSILQHLFCHLNFKSLLSNTIKKISFKENLFSLLILIFSNLKGYENLFLPIARMYKIFDEKIKSTENLKYRSYVDTYGNDNIKGINMMEDSIEYIGHKLLWYIDMSIRGNKFSLGMDANLLKFDTSSKDYQTFVAFIYYWILQEDVFTNLLRFDSYSFFNIIGLYFTDQLLLNIIKNYDFNLFDKNIIEKYNDEDENNFLKDKDAQKQEDKNKIEKDKEKEEKKEEKKEEEKKEEKEEKEEKKDLLEYNNTNAVINYIIQIAKKEKGFFLEIDLGILLLKYIFKYSEKAPIPSAIKKKVTESFKKCLTFYDDYKKLKETSPNEVEDIFNCHKVKKIDEIDKKNNSFYKEMYKALRDLLDSSYKWKKDDLNKLLEASKNCPFTLVKIRLYEYTKHFSDCLFHYLDENNNGEVFSEDVFAWLQRMFQAFSRKNDELNEVDFKNLQQTVIDNVGKLAKISIQKTNKIIKQFYGNDQKIIIIHKLDDAPLLQYEFIKQLISPTKGGGGRLEEIKNEDEENNDENDNINNKKNESLCNILLLEIDLLIKLKKFNEVLPSVREQLIIYPRVYPKEKCLQKCLDNNINDAAILIYQSLGETEKALELTRNSVEKAFENYLNNNNDDTYKKFLEELNLRVKICEDTSEYMEKNNFFKDSKSNNKSKISEKEIEDIWFTVLKQLYDFQKRGKENKEIEKKLQENINDLLRKMCLHVKLRNIIETVTDIEKDSQYKEFKNILGDMIKSNNNFNRILSNTMIIMKNCITKSEEERRLGSIKGNYFNYDKCDVCNKYIDDNKNEIISCFGCGHQSHENCAFREKEDYEEECYICKQSEIIDEYEHFKLKKGKKIEKEINDKNNEEKKEGENKIINNNEDDNENKEEENWFGNRDDNIKKLNDYDKRYMEMLGEI